MGEVAEASVRNRMLANFGGGGRVTIMLSVNSFFLGRPRAAFEPSHPEGLRFSYCLQGRDEESSKVGGYGLKGSVVLLKTALFEKGLPLASFLGIAREFVR